MNNIILYTSLSSASIASTEGMIYANNLTNTLNDYKLFVILICSIVLVLLVILLISLIVDLWRM